jgi:ABC-type polysaccharide/polyol phosphate export permease
LGAAPAPGTWWFLGCFTLLVVVLAAALYSSCRRRVVYWI